MYTFSFIHYAFIPICVIFLQSLQDFSEVTLTENKQEDKIKADTFGLSQRLQAEHQGEKPRKADTCIDTVTDEKGHLTIVLKTNSALDFPKP